jgi:preprotein translocase SecE subunit
MSTQRTLALSYLLIGVLVALTLEALLGSVVARVGALAPLNHEVAGIQNWTWTTLIAFAGAGALGWFAWRDARVHGPATEVVEELQRVTWPSAAETRTATWAVIIATFVCAVLLGAFDYFWSFATAQVYSP